MKYVEMAIAGTENPVQRWANIIFSLKQAIQDDVDILCKAEMPEKQFSMLIITRMENLIFPWH